MSTVLVLVGTRKGAFILESDTARHRWRQRGPYCDAWPMYRVVHEPRSGALLGAAASAWHGAGVWRSLDLGATWTFSSDGIVHPDPALRISKVSGLAAAHGRVLAGTEAAGLFASDDAGATWTAVTALDGQPGRELWNDPANQGPGNLGMPGILPHPDDPARLWVVVQGFGAFETVDGGASWTPRNRGLRTAWPLEEGAEVGYCVHRLVLAADRTRMYQQNHCGVHRSDDEGRTWREISDGLPSDFGLAAVAHPHDRDCLYVAPLDPGHGRTMPGRAAVWRTRDGGASWHALTRGLPQEDAYLGALRDALATDGLDVPGIYLGTSTGQLFASVDEGDSWREIASYLPGITSVEVAVVG